MKQVLWIIAASVVLHLPASAQRLSDLSWLAGCWESRNETRKVIIHEQWMKPAGGMMLGSGRTLDGEKAVDFEVLRIEQNGTAVIFYARPRGSKEETAFKAVKIGPTEAIFENKQHDFPQRIIYRLDGDKLFARVEGQKNGGKNVSLDFPMVRFRCDEGAAPVAAAASACPSRNGLTPAEITDLVNAHNSVRLQNDLPSLKWDCKLAETAQEWADRGVFEHRLKRQYGESLYVSAASTTKAVSAVEAWMVEKPNWDNKTGTCAAGKLCTHYTQMVWRSTAAIGCGINRNAPGNWKVLLVCNYHPAGNTGGAAF